MEPAVTILDKIADPSSGRILPQHKRTFLDVIPNRVAIIPDFNSDDFNNTHDTEGFDMYSILDDSSYTGEPVSQGLYDKAVKHDVLGIPTKVALNRYHNKQDLSYTGFSSVDYLGLDADERLRYRNFLQDLTPDELNEYSNFLGINFKKIGKAIGKAASGAAKGVAKGVTGVGKGIGHAAGWVGSEVAHAAVAAEKGVVKGAEGAVKGVAHAGVFVGKETAKGATFVGKETWRGTKFVAKEAAPYWKEIVSIGGVILLAATGVGLPIAIAAGTAMLTGLNQISTGNSANDLPGGYASGGSGTYDGSIDDTTQDGSPENDLQDTDGSNTPDGIDPDQAANSSPAGTPATSPLEGIAKYRTLIIVAGLAFMAYLLFKHKK